MLLRHGLDLCRRELQTLRLGLRHNVRCNLSKNLLLLLWRYHRRLGMARLSGSCSLDRLLLLLLSGGSSGSSCGGFLGLQVSLVLRVL